MKQRDDNKNIKQTKIAVDFQAKFNRPITRLCIFQVGNGEIVPVKLWAIIYGKGRIGRNSRGGTRKTQGSTKEKRLFFCYLKN